MSEVRNIKEEVASLLDKCFAEYSLPFKREDLTWTLESPLRGPSKVTINGRTMDLPASEEKQVLKVEIVGEGNVRDIETNRLFPFAQVCFTTIQCNRVIFSHEDSIYPEDSLETVRKIISINLGFSE